MVNPYDSPKTISSKAPLVREPEPQSRELQSFFVWYFGAFIVAQLFWQMSAFVRRLDFLEVPMAAVFFPLAAFFDPHDGMVNDRATFFYALAFWGVVALVSLLLTPKRINPLFFAFAIIVVSSGASILYAYLVVRNSGPVS